MDTEEMLSISELPEKKYVTHHFWDLYGNSNTQAEYISTLLQHYPTFPMAAMLNRSGDEIPNSSRSVQLLVHQALKIIELLQKNGAKKGDRVVLVLFPSVEFVIALYACFLGGFVGIPVPPPIRLSSDLLAFSNLVEKSGAKVALSHGIYQKFSSMQTITHKVSTFLNPSSWFGGEKDKKKTKKSEKIAWPSKLNWLYIDGCCSGSDKDVNFQKLVEKSKELASLVSPTDLAYLQLTSGSTADPKLVQITHRASILAVIAVLPKNQALTARFRLNEENYVRENCPWTPDPSSSCSSCSASGPSLQLCLNCHQTLCAACTQSRCVVHDERLSSRGVDVGPLAPLSLAGKSGPGGSVPSPVLFTHRFPKEKIVRPDYQRSGVLWIPHYHDFFMFYMFALFEHCSKLLIMSPIDFLAKPLGLLEACYKHKATSSCCPNFAFDYMVSKSTEEQRKELMRGIDTSEWITMITQGGEPLHKASLERFVQAFPFIGIERIQNAFGMAEAVAGVCVAPVGLDNSLLFIEKGLRTGNVKPLSENHPSAQGVYTCGYRLTEIDRRVNDDEAPNTRVIVVHTETHEELPDGCVGEVWVSSPAFGIGYFGWSDKENDEVFQALPKSVITAEEGRTFLRTGDRGFIYDGMVFLIGRLKATLILQGKNYEPSDIEYFVWGCHPGLRPGCAVALSIPNENLGTDELVFITEVRDESLKPEAFEEIAEAMRNALAEGFGLVTPEILFFGPKKGVLKTTSGKPKRNAIYEYYVTECYTPLYTSKESYELVGGMEEEGTEEEEEREEMELTPEMEQRVLAMVEKLRREDVEGEKEEEEEEKEACSPGLPPALLPSSPLDEAIAVFSVSSNDMVRLQSLINSEFGVYLPSGTLLRIDPNTTTVRQLFSRFVLPSLSSPTSPTSPISPASSPHYTSPSSYSTSPPSSYSTSDPIPSLGSPNFNSLDSSPRSPNSPPGSHFYTPPRKPRSARPSSSASTSSSTTPAAKRSTSNGGIRRSHFSSSAGVSSLSGLPRGGGGASFLTPTKSSVEREREKKEKKREKMEKKGKEKEKKGSPFVGSPKDSPKTSPKDKDKKVKRSYF